MARIGKVLQISGLLALALAQLSSTGCAVNLIPSRSTASGVAGSIGSPAPSGLSYSSPTAIYVYNDQDGAQTADITANTPTVTGSPTSYSIAPNLNTNTGLTFDTTTGTISGKPTATSAATTYTITASNSGGSINATVSIRTGPGFLVNDTGDASDANTGNAVCATAGAVCTLRAAVEQLNAFAAGVTRLVLLPAGTITLTGLSEIGVTSSMEIIGATRATTIIDGAATGAANSSQRIFNISGGAVTAVLTRMTLRNAKPPNNSPGGCVDISAATANLSDLAFEQCHSTGGGSAGGGGALRIDGTGANEVALTVSNCAFENNSASSGGAIYFANNTAASTISDCEFNNNGSAEGGAVGLGGNATPSSTNVTFTNCKFENNTSSGAGGAFAFSGATASCTIERSLFNGNTANANGGAIDMGAGTASHILTNNTFFDNEAGADGTGNGGAVYANGSVGSPHVLTNNTFVSNTAPDTGGVAGSGPVTATNNLFHQNLTTTVPGTDNCAVASMTSGGGNLASNTIADCSDFTDGTDQLNVTPLLGALADNGGTWNSIELQAGPGADQGVNGACPAVDQRGLPRPVNVTCDIGSFEIQ